MLILSVSNVYFSAISKLSLEETVEPAEANVRKWELSHIVGIIVFVGLIVWIGLQHVYKKICKSFIQRQKSSV